MGFIQPGVPLHFFRAKTTPNLIQKILKRRSLASRRSSETAHQRTRKGHSLDNLPPEIIHKVFLDLPMEDLANFSVVNRHLHQVLTCSSYLCSKVLECLIYDIARRKDKGVLRVLNKRALNYKFVLVELLKRHNIDLILPQKKIQKHLASGSSISKSKKPGKLPERFTRNVLENGKLKLAMYLARKYKLYYEDVSRVLLDAFSSSENGPDTDVVNGIMLCTETRELDSPAPLLWALSKENYPLASCILAYYTDQTYEDHSASVWETAKKHDSMAHFLLNTGFAHHLKMM